MYCSGPELFKSNSRAWRPVMCCVTRGRECSFKCTTPNKAPTDPGQEQGRSERQEATALSKDSKSEESVSSVSEQALTRSRCHCPKQAKGTRPHCSSQRGFWVAEAPASWAWKAGYLPLPPTSPVAAADSTSLEPPGPWSTWHITSSEESCHLPILQIMPSMEDRRGSQAWRAGPWEAATSGAATSSNLFSIELCQRLVTGHSIKVYMVFN